MRWSFTFSARCWPRRSLSMLRDMSVLRDMSMLREMTVLLDMSVLVLASSLLITGTAAADACWRPPVDAEVVDPFRPPACTWCPGNRGLEYGTSSGTVVRAVATGEVTFSGTVAGVRYVVLRHADGRRATYGGLAETTLRAGAVVASGAVVGVTSAHLYFGLRDGDTYIDPAPFLGRMIGRPRLVPDDGTVARAAPPPRLRCG